MDAEQGDPDVLQKEGENRIEMPDHGFLRAEPGRRRVNSRTKKGTQVEGPLPIRHFFRRLRDNEKNSEFQSSILLGKRVWGYSLPKF